MNLFIQIHICTGGSQIKVHASADHSENTEWKINKDVVANHLK